jgi:hypothetical protein
LGIAVLASSALVMVWHSPDWSARRWLVLGALTGFAAIVHPIGVAWALLPLTSLLGLDAGTVASDFERSPGSCSAVSLGRCRN